MGTDEASVAECALEVIERFDDAESCLLGSQAMHLLLLAAFAPTELLRDLCGLAQSAVAEFEAKVSSPMSRGDDMLRRLQLESSTPILDAPVTNSMLRILQRGNADAPIDQAAAVVLPSVAPSSAGLTGAGKFKEPLHAVWLPEEIERTFRLGANEDNNDEPRSNNKWCASRLGGKGNLKGLGTLRAASTYVASLLNSQQHDNVFNAHAGLYVLLKGRSVDRRYAELEKSVTGRMVQRRCRNGTLEEEYQWELPISAVSRSTGIVVGRPQGAAPTARAADLNAIARPPAATYVPSAEEVAELRASLASDEFLSNVPWNDAMLKVALRVRARHAIESGVLVSALELFIVEQTFQKATPLGEITSLNGFVGYAARALSRNSTSNPAVRAAVLPGIGALLSSMGSTPEEERVVTAALQDGLRSELRKSRKAEKALVREVSALEAALKTHRESNANAVALAALAAQRGGEVTRLEAANSKLKAQLMKLRSGAGAGAVAASDSSQEKQASEQAARMREQVSSLLVKTQAELKACVASLAAQKAARQEAEAKLAERVARDQEGADLRRKLEEITAQLSKGSPIVSCELSDWPPAPIFQTRAI